MSHNGTIHSYVLASVVNISTENWFTRWTCRSHAALSGQHDMSVWNKCWCVLFIHSRFREGWYSSRWFGTQSCDMTHVTWRNLFLHICWEELNKSFWTVFLQFRNKENRAGNEWTRDTSEKIMRLLVFKGKFVGLCSPDDHFSHF